MVNYKFLAEKEKQIYNKNDEKELKTIKDLSKIVRELKEVIDFYKYSIEVREERLNKDIKKSILMEG